MVPAAVLCLALLVPISVFGEGFARVSLPIPVEIEGQPMHCQLYFKLEMKNYNLPFDKFAAGPMDKPETMFATAVEALRSADATKFASVWTSPDEMKGHGGVTVKMADESAAGWMKLARSNFDFDHLTVVAEVLLGPDSMFVFDAATKGGIQRYALYVGLDQKDRVRLSAVGSNTPLELMVLNSFIAARTSPDEFKPLSNINLRYQYPIPLAGKMDSGAHPVFFEFDGSPIDFPLINEKVKPPTPLLEFLRGATLAFDGGKYDVYAGDFTPNSQERAKPWLADMARRKQEELEKEKLGQEKQPPPAVPPATQTKTVLSPLVQPYVKFVLNAEPIFLVFQAAGPGSNWKPANLTVTYLLHQDGEYKIANFAFSNTLDDFLQDPALFDKRVLKPPPLTPGAPKAKAVPVPVKPAAVKH